MIRRNTGEGDEWENARNRSSPGDAVQVWREGGPGRSTGRKQGNTGNGATNPRRRWNLRTVAVLAAVQH